MRDGEHWLEAAFHASSDGMFFHEIVPHGRAGKCVQANDTICRMLGYTAEQIRELTPGDIIIEDGQAGDTKTLICKDGRRIQAWIQSRITSNNGLPVALIVVRDGSSSAFSEEALHRFELLLAHVRDIILFVRRSDGRIVEANAAACEHYGYTREELLALNIAELRAAATLEQVARQMETADTATILFETLHRRKDGTVFPVEVSSQGATIAGSRTLISVIRDITPRKRAEEALRQSEERFRRALENIPDVVTIYDRALRIQYINSATTRITGRLPSDFIGRRDDEVWPPEVYSAYRPTLQSALETRKISTIEVSLPLPATGVRALRITCVPILDERGEVREILGITQDFTERQRSEEAVRSMALFPEQNPAPVLRVRGDGALLFANPAAGPLIAEWGCATGHSVPQFVRRVVDATLASGRLGELELSFAGRDYSFTMAPVAGRDYINLFAHDITERKAAQRVLSEAKDRQEILAEVIGRLLASEEPRAIVESLARKVMDRLDCHAFFNYLLDPGQGRLRLNACAGIDEEAARRIEWLDLGSAVCGCVARDGFRIVAENILEGRDIRTDLVKSFGIRAYACHPLLSGGRVIGTLSFGTRSRDSFSGDDLALMETVTSHIAIAMERVRSRDLLRTSEERYRAIARGIPDGAVWVVDPELRFVAAEGDLIGRLGLARERLEGGRLRDVLDEKSREVEEPRFLRALAGETASYEMDDGSRILWSQYTPLRDEAGRITGAMALTLDVTGRKRLEARLLQSQKMESIAVLAGGIAHDFNNLLVGVIGNASLATDLLPPGSAVSGTLREIVRAGERAAHLTREMLAYSGKGRFIIERVNLSELVESTTALVRSSVPNHVMLRLDLQPDVPPIEADVAQVQQIVMNLVINAAEAIGEQRGIITVRAASVEIGPGGTHPEWADADLREGVYAGLEVRDTGCGMDPGTKAKIFDPFFTTKFTGRGLGLAAVSGIVRGHKGALKVDSAPGQGSVFAIVFPAAPGGVPAPESRADAGLKTGSGRVLVVDDESIVRQLAWAALERLGYRVAVAESGPAAITALARDPRAIDLLVLDLSMPGMGGQEALSRLRAIRPDLPVIMSSGYSEAECLRLFENERLSGFLQKPYTAATLARVVEQALADR